MSVRWTAHVEAALAGHPGCISKPRRCSSVVMSPDGFCELEGGGHVSLPTSWMSSDDARRLAADLTAAADKADARWRELEGERDEPPPYRGTCERCGRVGAALHIAADCRTHICEGCLTNHEVRP